MLFLYNKFIDINFQLYLRKKITIASQTSVFGVLGLTVKSETWMPFQGHASSILIGSLMHILYYI